jgi:hypothetical protein
MDDAIEIAKEGPATVAGSSLCSKCRERPRRRHGAYCKPCEMVAQETRRRLQKSLIAHCIKCHARLPHKGGQGCPETMHRWRVQRGRQNINQRWPGYGDLLTNESLLHRAGVHWPGVQGFPLPSELFHGLNAALDQRLIRDGRDKDVKLCQAIASVAAMDQREFLELYLSDPKDAQHWAELPRWKRPIRRGDPDDVLVWKFFTMQRLNMEQAAAEAPPWSMASQGAQLPQMFGTLMRLSPHGVQKLGLVMNAFGDALQYGRDLGNVIKKPWDEQP